MMMTNYQLATYAIFWWSGGFGLAKEWEIYIPYSKNTLAVKFFGKIGELQQFVKFFSVNFHNFHIIAYSFTITCFPSTQC